MDIPQRPTWLPPFKGAAYSYLDCEVLAFEKIEAPMREALWANQDTIWFDYARLHPVKALYLFCDAYSRAYGDYLAANIDMDMKYARGLKGDPLDSRELRSFIGLKREADARGIPYEIWLRRLFTDFASQGWTRPPRPAHLLNNTEAHEKAELWWAEALNDITFYAKDDWFTTGEFVGHSQQTRYEDWIVDSLRLRHNRDIALASTMYEKDALRIERALAEFGEGTVTEAQRWQLRFAAISQQ